MASHLPSGESPWLPVQSVAPPRSIAAAWPPVAGMVQRRPLRVKMRDLPSRVQLGASMRLGSVNTTAAIWASLSMAMV